MFAVLIAGTQLDDDEKRVGRIVEFECSAADREDEEPNDDEYAKEE